MKPKKDDLCTRPNRNSAKRAKRDAEDSPHFEPKHTTNGDSLDNDKNDDDDDDDSNDNASGTQNSPPKNKKH